MVSWVRSSKLLLFQPAAGLASSLHRPPSLCSASLPQTPSVFCLLFLSARGEVKLCRRLVTEDTSFQFSCYLLKWLVFILRRSWSLLTFWCALSPSLGSRCSFSAACFLLCVRSCFSSIRPQVVSPGLKGEERSWTPSDRRASVCHQTWRPHLGVCPSASHFQQSQVLQGTLGSSCTE